MSKVITFSRTFPSYHPRKGEPTYFVEQILEWLWDTWEENPYPNVPEMLIDLNCREDSWTEEDIMIFNDQLEPDLRQWKGHTIRAGQRFKPGDLFKPVVWGR